MRKFILVVFFVFAWAAIAQTAEMKIGYVDLNKALNESDSGKQATKLLEINESGILYSPKKYDVTDKVIKRCNEAAKAKK
ncbi:MAG: hypothetical protein HY758_06570 [Nitrospirae bacterium]|nr:hypothetical protein [Nitrospirota bacterium]